MRLINFAGNYNCCLILSASRRIAARKNKVGIVESNPSHMIKSLALGRPQFVLEDFAGGRFHHPHRPCALKTIYKPYIVS